MALVSLPGARRAFIGPDPWLGALTPPTVSSSTVDAVNEAVIMVGQIETSDEGSHTINTTGSSSIAWRSGSVTFANAATTLKVGIAAVDTATGPPARAVNVADVITFDVSKSLIGGAGGVTANATQNHVPDAGSKTMAHGDLVAVCIQMTARGGVDTVGVTTTSVGTALQRPSVTTFSSSAYGESSTAPNVFITFADGATGWIAGAAYTPAISTRVFSSGVSPNEYGQLYQFGFPLKIYGIYGWFAPGNDLDVVLYSDPLGSPVAEKTVAFDANTVTVSTGRRFTALFSSPYSAVINAPIAAVIKPGAANVSAYYKTLSAAGQRSSDIWGTSGYGISRTSGAFANANASLDHYYIGLLAGGFDVGGGGGGGFSAFVG